MKIGIIGAGAIGKLYGKLWHKAGHEIMLSSRHPETIDTAEVGETVKAGSVADASRFGDVILLAVSYWTIDEAITAMDPHITDKLVIDATNPLEWADDGNTVRVIDDDAIAALVMKDKLPEARVAKAFTTLWAGHVEQLANQENPGTAMALAADTSEDRQIVTQLTRDAGLIPIDLGGLSDSRLLDPPSPIWNVVLSSEEMKQIVADFRNNTST